MFMLSKLKTKEEGEDEGEEIGEGEIEEGYVQKYLWKGGEERDDKVGLHGEVEVWWTSWM